MDILQKHQHMWPCVATTTTGDDVEKNAFILYWIQYRILDECVSRKTMRADSFLCIKRTKWLVQLKLYKYMTNEYAREKRIVLQTQVSCGSADNSHMPFYTSAT